MMYDDQLSIALLESAGVAISFSTAAKGAPAAPAKDVKVLPAQLSNSLNVAFWGGDNKYPQNVTDQLAKCSVARSILDFKAKALLGDGIVYGTTNGFDEEGNEIFTPASAGQLPMVDKLFTLNNNFSRFYLEFNQDWTHFGNCFPRFRLNNAGTEILYLVHEESSDCRYQQMDAKGKINNVYLSKYWADIDTQYLKADKDDNLQDGTKGRKVLPREVDNDIIKQVRCLDMYDSMEDLKLAVAAGDRNMILPVNYPSPGKTYYQSSVWDALRLAGWLEIAEKIPEMLQALYTKAFLIKYHVQVPESYFSATIDKWTSLDKDEQKKHRQRLVAMLDTYLKGAENAYTSLVTFFQYDKVNQTEFGKITIESIENKVDIDKDILLTSVINQEIAFALQMNPAIIGAGAPGKSSPGSGSDIREAFLVYCAMLKPERQLILEPLRLAALFNGAPANVAFRFRDTKLTTLDTNSGTEKVLS